MCKSDFHFLMVDWKADQVISVDSLSLYYWWLAALTTVHAWLSNYLTGENSSTVKPCSTDTHLIWTPVYNIQLCLS